MVLFIAKQKSNLTTDTKNQHSTGLYNSVRFVSDMLTSNDIENEIEIVVDYNRIDGVLHKHKPKIAIVEALWVLPSKLTELQYLHKNTTFIVRIHSDTPFIATEGMAMSWISDYLAIKNVIVAPNSPRLSKELKMLFPEYAHKVQYLPNYYPVTFKDKKLKDRDTIDISCFGAIRPLKNHLIQAVASIAFAKELNKNLNFHINYTRVEGRGEAILKNLIGLFGSLDSSKYKLVAHKWLDHERFTEVCGNIDIALQTSFSETFNIVGTDHLSQGVPVVGSKGELPWSCDLFNANPTDVDDIIRKLRLSYRFSRLNTTINKYMLKRYTKKAESIWISVCR